MYEYFVEKSANETGEYVVHSSACSSLPTEDKLMYLGVRSNVTAPLKEAANWFGSSTPCPECMPAK